MTGDGANGGPRRWVAVRMTHGGETDAAILRALGARARTADASFALLLLGSATYDLERPAGPVDGDAGTIELFALQEDVEGRGIRPRRPTTLIGYPELVRLLFDSERVMEIG